MKLNTFLIPLNILVAVGRENVEENCLKIAPHEYFKTGQFCSRFFLKVTPLTTTFTALTVTTKLLPHLFLPDLAVLDFELFFLSSQIPKSIYFCPLCLFIPPVLFSSS